MLASIKPLFVILVCCSTTGCLLPMSIGLLSKPIGYMIDQHMAKSALEDDQPISVSAMLANARGDEITTDATVDESGVEDKCVSKTGSISVADMLANARSSDAGDDINATSSAETNQFKKAYSQTPVSDYPLTEVSKRGLMTVVMGTQTDDVSPPPVFPLFVKAREICTSLGESCDPADIRMDTTLPLGTLQITPMGSADDA